MINIYFDTNILLDIALERKPFDEQALELLKLIENNQITGFLNAITVVNVYYFLSKQKGKAVALQFIKDTLKVFRVTNIDKSVLTNASQSSIKDFEDAVQEFSAINSGLKMIVTRNTIDFKNSQLLVFEPLAFIEWTNNNLTE